MASGILLLASFLLFMLFFAGVGLASMMVKEDTTDDYLVAGRGMHPALAALSAVSTWNSGYMFIGFIGFIFLNGYSAIWIALVSTIGQLVAWIWLYKYIQKEGEQRGIRSLSSLVSSTTGSPEAKVAAVLSVVFLSIYAAAQLTAGGVALEVMLDWAPTVGILIGFVLVGRLLLCWWNPCINMDRRGSIMRHDCRLHDSLPRCDWRIWWVLRPAQSTRRYRSCHGESLPNWTKIRCYALDHCVLPRRPWSRWTTSSGLTRNDLERR
jgi:hypothetical protein